MIPRDLSRRSKHTPLLALLQQLDSTVLKFAASMKSSRPITECLIGRNIFRREER